MKRTALRPVSAKRLALLRQEGGSLRRTALKAGPGLERRGRVNPVNPRRARIRKARNFGPKADWIREMQCAVCFAQPPSDPHHVTTRGAGGTSADLVPLCNRCHREGHAMGWKSFEAEFRTELRDLAAELEARWQLRKGSDA